MNPFSSKASFVIIVGAARSGTNMLRDVLTRINGYETWPCDEIPYIWRYGNARHPDDELMPEMATKNTKSYIRKSFRRMAVLTRAKVLVEKTCANSLRVGFVRSILPEVKLLYIHRDGRDAVSSAMKRWVAPFDIRYSLKKAPFVPLGDLPYYGARFVFYRVKQQFSEEKRLATWGPAFRCMSEMARNASLEELCAHQWLRSVENSERDLNDENEGGYIRISYESFVENPVKELGRIVDFIGHPVGNLEIENAVSSVSKSSVGKARKNLSDESLSVITRIIEPGLERYSYPR